MNAAGRLGMARAREFAGDKARRQTPAGPVASHVGGPARALVDPQHSAGAPRGGPRASCLPCSSSSCSLPRSPYWSSKADGAGGSGNARPVPCASTPPFISARAVLTLRHHVLWLSEEQLALLDEMSNAMPREANGAGPLGRAESDLMRAPTSPVRAPLGTIRPLSPPLLRRRPPRFYAQHVYSITHAIPKPLASLRFALERLRHRGRTSRTMARRGRGGGGRRGVGVGIGAQLLVFFFTDALLRVARRVRVIYGPRVRASSGCASSPPNLHDALRGSCAHITKLLPPYSVTLDGVTPMAPQCAPRARSRNGPESNGGNGSGALRSSAVTRLSAQLILDDYWGCARAAPGDISRVDGFGQDNARSA